MTRTLRREALLGYALILPSLVVFGVFVFYPLVRTIYLGFFETNQFGTSTTYVGINQYRDTLTSEDFRNSLWVTVKYTVMTVPTGILLGTILAVLANQRLRGIAVFRTIFASTVVTSVAAASVMFYTLFNPSIGLVNYYKQEWFGGPPLDVLGDPQWALVGIAIATIWQNLGITFVVVLAGLQSVPEELDEAARIDGAGPVRRFWSVTVPLLSPTLFFAAVVLVINAFQSFGLVDLLTEGGPRNSTDVLVYAIYQEAFEQPINEGRAAVLAMTLFVILLILTLVQLRFVERRVFYGR